MGTIGKAREEALRVLQKVRVGALVADALKEATRHDMTPADRALMAQIVYGVLRHRRYLDAWIRPFQRQALEPDVMDILRMAFFQLGFLDRVPAYAVVNGAVELTHRTQPRAANTVNAILRRGQTQKPLHLPLAERFSHPDWLVERWIRRYGERIRGILEEDQKIPPLTLRVDLSKTTRQEVLLSLLELGIEASPSTYLPEAIRVTGSLWLEDFPPFQEGLVSVQDESGMLVSWVLDAAPGDRVLDMAAGLGGKSLHVLEHGQGLVSLTAVDMSGERVKGLLANAHRLQRSLEAVESTAEAFCEQHPEGFNRVLLDAPCSGLGVLRRRVDARWKKSPRDFPALHQLQLELVSAAVTACQPGGVIVYSTCSVEPEETRDVIREALARWPGLVRESVEPYLPHPDLIPLVQEDMFMSAPGELGMDGFFICRLKWTGGRSR